MRKAISTMLWVLAAVGLTSIGTAAVNLVTFQVNDSPSAPLSVEALEALPSVPTVPSTAPPLTTSTDPVAPPRLATDHHDGASDDVNHHRSGNHDGHHQSLDDDDGDLPRYDDH